MKTLLWPIAPLCLLSVFLVGQDLGAQDKDSKDKKKQSDELTLETLFPDKGLFGPSARSTSFSHDGRYAAWLYRPYIERRHGYDLWVLDTDSGDVKRLTSASVLAPFQKSTRKVVDDRKEQAKKARKKEEASKDDSKDSDSKNKDGEKDKKDTSKVHDADWVGDDDADREKAPRYRGVSSYAWSPNADELLFTSEGDIYRYILGDEGPVRLTKTKDSENAVQYLPQGGGYTCLRGGSLMKVTFDSHLVEQIDPKVPSGESMYGYSLSPDAKRLTFLTRKGSSTFQAGRKVSIASYRGRFLSVREYNRHVSDDPIPDSEIAYYLYELTDPMKENGHLTKIHSHKVSGPRDIHQVPEWAPDSSKVVFAVFDQETENIEILESSFDTDEDSAESEKKDTDSKEEDSKEEDSKDDKGEKESTEKKEKADETPFKEAKVVYRWLHTGGPNTPSMVRPYYLEDNRRIVFLSEQSGFRHVHLLDPLYRSTEQLTKGYYEVYPNDISKDHRHLFVAATKEHPSRQDLYRIDLGEGSMTRLTDQTGSYSSAAIAPDGESFLANFVSFGHLAELVYSNGKKERSLTDSHPQKAKDLTGPVPEFFSYKNRHGHDIQGHVFKPEGWSKDERRPLLIYVYGGPLGTRKQVVQGNFNTSSYFFAYYMAKKHGYVTCTIDPRGTSGYGAVFESANFEQVGKPQVEDLVDGVKHFIANYGVDEKRVAIHGWSFGGFQTQMCLYTEPKVFAAGIAGAGPTEWENYNSWYSTGTIGKSRKGTSTPDLKKFSLLPLAKNLESRLLLIHGMEDANVLYQDTVRVYRELLKAGKETLVELFLDPTGGHGLGGDVKTLGRFRKYEEFLLRTVGTSETKATP